MLANALRRAVINVAAAACRTWLRSRTRRTVRRAISLRTVALLEQCDEDARALRELRDQTIPRAFRELAQMKVELLEQLDRFGDGDVAVPSPVPDPAPRVAAWSPNAPAKPCARFQRTNQQ